MATVLTHFSFSIERQCIVRIELRWMTLNYLELRWITLNDIVRSLFSRIGTVLFIMQYSATWLLNTFCSGKTLAYILPIISGIVGDRLPPLPPCTSSPPRPPSALILSPTRELASQISKHVVRFSQGTSLKCVPLYGGVSVAHNIQQIQEVGVLF